MSNKSSNSNTYSIISMVLGGLAFLFLPPFLGGAGVILAVIGKQKNEKLWAIGLTVSIVGAVVGMIFGVAVAGMSKEVTEGISFGIKSYAVTNFLKTNKISPDIKLTSFSMNDEKVNQLLEESTVYIFCE